MRATLLQKSSTQTPGLTSGENTDKTFDKHIPLSLFGEAADTLHRASGRPSTLHFTSPNNLAQSQGRHINLMKRLSKDIHSFRKYHNLEETSLIMNIPTSISTVGFKADFYDEVNLNIAHGNPENTAIADATDKITATAAFKEIKKKDSEFKQEGPTLKINAVKSFESHLLKPAAERANANAHEPLEKDQDKVQNYRIKHRKINALINDYSTLLEMEATAKESFLFNTLEIQMTDFRNQMNAENNKTKSGQADHEFCNKKINTLESENKTIRDQVSNLIKSIDKLTLEYNQLASSSKGQKQELKIAIDNIARLKLRTRYLKENLDVAKRNGYIVKQRQEKKDSNENLEYETREIESDEEDQETEHIESEFINRWSNFKSRVTERAMILENATKKPIQRAESSDVYSRENLNVEDTDSDEDWKQTISKPISRVKWDGSVIPPEEKQEQKYLMHASEIASEIQSSRPSSAAKSRPNSASTRMVFSRPGSAQKQRPVVDLPIKNQAIHQILGILKFAADQDCDFANTVIKNKNELLDLVNSISHQEAKPRPVTPNLLNKELLNAKIPNPRPTIIQQVKKKRPESAPITRNRPSSASVSVVTKKDARQKELGVAYQLFDFERIDPR